MVRLAVLLIVIAVFMLVEARRASAHERMLLASGGIEARHDVYHLMQVVYPGVFVAMLVDGLFHPQPPPWIIAAGAVLFAAGKTLKWWAILALGRFWTFRVIVLPGSTPIHTGPYRYLRHPNYVGVAGELVGVAMLAGAPVAGPLGTALFIALMAVRAVVENRTRDAILRRGA